MLALPTLCAGAAVNVVFVAEAPFPELGTQPSELAVDFARLLRVYFPGYSHAELSTVMKRDALNVVARCTDTAPVRPPAELRNYTISEGAAEETQQ
jgi:hypothetical protein